MRAPYRPGGAHPLVHPSGRQLQTDVVPDRRAERDLDSAVRQTQLAFRQRPRQAGHHDRAQADNGKAA